jgi:hypothetical protein
VAAQLDGQFLGPLPWEEELASVDLDDLPRTGDQVAQAMAAGFGVFLDRVLEPEVQRILVTDGPAVLGLARFIELDERYALEPAVEALEAAGAAGLLRVEDPPTLVRLLFGAMTRAGLLIASSPDPKATRDAVGVTFRQMLSGFLQTQLE